MATKYTSSKPMLRAAFFLSLVTSGLTLAAAAQVSSADIVGTVTDATGAIIPGAKVVLTNTATKVQATVTSNKTGDYNFTFLIPGPYSISVEFPGFSKLILGNIVLVAGDRARENAALLAGSAGETVEVTAEVPLLQREDSAISSVVTETAVQDLPLNARNYVNLVQIQPGVNAGSPQAVSAGGRPDDRRANSEVSANGQSEQFNNNLIDGLDNNEILAGLVAVRPSVDAIAEIKIDTNDFSAEIGRDAGAVVNIITKSGTNTLHGSVYEYFRNDIVDARDFFAKAGSQQKPEYRQNQFGGSIGGPIFRDKTFFFADIEDSRIIQGQSTGNLTVPTLFEEQNPGNFSDNTLNGKPGPNFPAAALTPAGLAYFRLFPAPNVPNAAGGIAFSNNYSNVIKRTSFALTGDARVDQHFSNGDTLYGRYSYNRTVSTLPSDFPAVTENGITVQPNGSLLSFAGGSNQTAHSTLLNYVHVFNQNAILELKTGYTRVSFISTTLNGTTNVDSAFGVPNGNIPTLTGTGGLTPTLFLSGGYGSLGDSPYIPFFNIQNSFQEQGSLTYNYKKHVFKFGAQVFRRQLNYYQSSFPIGLLLYAGVTGNALEDLLTGTSIGYERSNTLNRPGFRRWEPSGYFQDNWRATSSLTINAGLRYEVFTPFTEAHNRYANFDYNTLTLITGAQDPHVGLSARLSNFAPRVGFAESIGQHTVIRGGYGVSYYPAQISLAVLLNNPPNVYQSTNIGVAAIGQPLPVPAVPSTTNLSGSLTYASSNLNTSIQQMFNLAVQQEIASNVVTLAYVGEIGNDGLFQPTVNIPNPNGPYPNAATPGAPPAFTTAAQLPNVGPIQGYLPTAVSNYSALQAIFARRLKSGLTVSANYTLAHGLSDGSSGTGELGSGQGLIASNPRYDYGNAANDVRHRFVVAVTYDLPFGATAHGFRGIAEKGWSTNLIDFWQTGLPFTVTSSAPNPNGLAQINLPNVTTDRPNIIGNGRLAHPTLGQYFNTQAFTPQAPGTAGNEGFNQLYGPHQRRADLSIFKTTQLEGRTQLQFRAECFNISNTPSFFVGAASTNISSYQTTRATGPLPGDVPTSAGGFGAIQSTTDPRQSARQFQFALKLLF